MPPNRFVLILKPSSKWRSWLCFPFWKHVASSVRIIPHCSISHFAFPYFSLFRTGFYPLHYSDVRDIEIICFLSQQHFLYGVIHSFTSKCYLCGEVSQTPSPFISINLQAHITLSWNDSYSSIDTFPSLMSLTYVEARLVFLHSHFVVKQKYATIKTSSYDKLKQRH